MAVSCWFVFFFGFGFWLDVFVLFFVWWWNVRKLEEGVLVCFFLTYAAEKCGREIRGGGVDLFVGCWG